jgi:hypothetical protein
MAMLGISILIPLINMKRREYQHSSEENVKLQMFQIYHINTRVENRLFVYSCYYKHSNF